MKDFQKTIEQVQEFLKLSPEEKFSMREKISHALHTSSAHPSPYMLKHAFRFTQKFIFRSAVALLMVSMIGGAGIVGVSAQALPGDTLYTTKINIEDLRATLKTSPESKIAFDIKRTESRFKEVRQLVKDGAFDEVKKDIITKNIESHVISATEEVSKVAFSEPEHHKVITEQIKDQLEKERESIIELATEEALDIHKEHSLVETKSILALTEVAKTTQEQVTKIEKIQDTITEVIEESKELPVSETLPLTSPTDEELLGDTLTLENETSLPSPISTPEEDKLFIESTLATLKKDLEKLTRAPVLQETLSVDLEPLTLLQSSTPTPTTNISTDITIAYDLLISAYESGNYAAAKTLIKKIHMLIDTLTQPAPTTPTVTVPVIELLETPPSPVVVTDASYPTPTPEIKSEEKSLSSVIRADKINTTTTQR